ncbi:MarR family transcriptional regulator [Actinocorallia sp. API 0066]|uniref:MarR family winged helix-turn-helix transcriptional regulator n=1 Tax=Actinocorallia sp. API 0066 TaxID=2896846 RepID=UPI001E4540AE|nr:MarR family transcriptional regulator [Actinocorallia sp. API 0066]MCD0448049.1 MarR family transcriptional regulator [Actinocorallia sp. API 0066]
MTDVSTLPGATISPRDLAVWRTLLRAQVHISRRLHQDLVSAHDLALGSYDVLQQLAEQPDGRLRMNDLADRVLLSRSGLTRLADRLQREGLLRRESCASDARGLFAVITLAGRERLQRATATHHRGVREHLIDRLDAAEMAQLRAILDKLAPDYPVALSA